MTDLQGGLYSSNAQVRAVTKVFLQVHQCRVCDRYFTEMENVGQWKCKWHPGEWDGVRRKWTCCGQTERKNVGDHSYLGRYMPWNPKEYINMPGPHSKGCTKCDCVSKYKNPVPQTQIVLEDIACIIPQLAAYGKALQDRPGLEKGRTPMIKRKQELPEIHYDFMDI